MNFIARQCIKIIYKELQNVSPICGLQRALSFKSAYSLENLYPNSSLKIHTPNAPQDDPLTTFNGYIPLKEIEITYTGSSGPGGQNVNKVNTKVDLRFHVKTASWLSDELKNKLLEKHNTKINKDGYLIVKSELTRSQQLNVADAFRKLRQMIRDLIVISEQPSELTKEKHRKNQIKASQERLFVKRIKSQVKRNRQNLSSDF